MDSDRKAIQQIEFVGQSKIINDINADGTQNISILTISKKIKQERLKFSEGCVKVLRKIANYQEARVKLTNTQLNKLKSVAKK